MSGVRVYDDEADLDNVVCPPDPDRYADMSPGMRQWMQGMEQERQKRETDAQAREQASEQKSRDFSISKDSATGGSPEEDY